MTDPRADDESASLAPAASPYRWRVLLGVWGLYVGFGLVSASLAPLVGTISDDLGLSRAKMGSVLGAWPLMYLIVAVPAGRLLTRIGLRWGLTIGIALIALSGVLRALATGWISLFAAVAVFGLGGPMISIGTPALISSWFAGEARGSATGAAVSGPVIGGVVALLLTNSVLMPATGDRWRLVVLIYAAGAVLAGLLWLVATASPPAAIVSPWKPTTGRRHGSRSLLGVPAVRVVLVLALGTFFINHSVRNWLPEMLRDSGLSAAEAGAWAAIPSLAGLAGGIVVPRLAKPERRRLVLASSYCLMGLGIATLLGPWSPITIGGLVVLGFMRTAVLPVAMLFLMDDARVGPTNMAAAGGLYFTAGEVGGVTGPLLVGVLASGPGAGFGAAQTVLVVVTAIMAVVALSPALRGSLSPAPAAA